MRVGGQNGAGGALEGDGAALELASGSPDAGFDFEHGQGPADDSGRANQHLLRCATNPLGGQGSHAAGIVQAALTRASIGVARTDDDPASLAAWKALAANTHRRGYHAIAGKDPGRARRPIARYQGQIKPLGIGSNATMKTRKAIAAGQGLVFHASSIQRLSNQLQNEPRP